MAMNSHADSYSGVEHKVVGVSLVLARRGIR